MRPAAFSCSYLLTSGYFLIFAYQLESHAFHSSGIVYANGYYSSSNCLLEMMYGPTSHSEIVHLSVVKMHQAWYTTGNRGKKKGSLDSCTTLLYCDTLDFAASACRI